MVAPRNATVVASSADAPAAVLLDGAGLEEGDRVAWVEAGADCAALPNTSWTALRADGTAAAALAASEEAYRLCYGFGGGAWPAVLMPGVYLRAAAVTAPAEASRVVAGDSASIELGGVGLRDGDRAQWVPAADGAAACETAEDAAVAGAVLQDGSLTFTLPADASTTLALCYRFAGAASYAHFPGVTVVPLRVAPGAHTFVLGEYATLRVDGAGSSGVGQGDRAKWVNDGDTCNDADAAGSGDQPVVAGADAVSVTFMFSLRRRRSCFATDSVISTGDWCPR